MRCDNNIQKNHTRILLVFSGKCGKRLIVEVAMQHGGVTVQCKQNMNRYHICELFFTINKIEDNNYLAL